MNDSDWSDHVIKMVCALIGVGIAAVLFSLAYQIFHHGL